MADDNWTHLDINIRDPINCMLYDTEVSNEGKYMWRQAMIIGKD